MTFGLLSLKEMENIFRRVLICLGLKSVRQGSPEENLAVSKRTTDCRA